MKKENKSKQKDVVPTMGTRSECCDAPLYISIETPICMECKEHCDVIKRDVNDKPIGLKDL